MIVAQPIDGWQAARYTENTISKEVIPMKIDFSRGAWNTDELTHAYSYRFEETPEFDQLDDCVQNRRNSDAKYGFDNITLLSRKEWQTGARISTRCAFQGDGAPLIVIADKLYTDARGVARYGDYIEVVLYRGGMNVWRMVMKEGKVSWKKLVGVEYPVACGDIHDLSVEITPERLNIEAAGQKTSLLVDGLYTTFHLGINACEGFNRFYGMTIEGETVQRY